MAKKEFQAESKRLLELMIHSIYTHKDIFLRELISNASDATDKRYYQQVQSGGEGMNREELPITIGVDKEARTITIADNGIGMTEEELEKNLGTIAQSGSFEFKKDMEKNEDVDIIGQFGVGFYSAFMVADNVTVTTKTQDGPALQWESQGVDGYVITPAEKAEVGTTIVLTIKESTEEEDYDQFLEDYKLQGLVKKHSDYIRYPIQMEVSKSRPIETEGDEDEDKEPEYETYQEIETLNSMTPIWKRKKSEVTDEDYNSFYKEKFYDYQDPAKVIYTSTEGASTYDALLFIPSHLPMNYHSKDYQKGLQLYASGVLIMEHCADLLPDYFGFVRGVVDSQDLSLNISREMLQHDRQLSFIAKRLEKKIQSELLSMQQNDKEKYTAFFKDFGISLKYGIYESYGAQKDSLQDLLLFHSSNGEMTTLKEYVDRMPEDQKYIYYASGENLAQLEHLPAAETVREKGFEILYFTEQVDEFMIRMMNTYGEKEFRSITSGDLGLETEEEKEEMEQQSKDSADLLAALKEALDGKVVDVRLSQRLKTHPVCLTTQGEITLEMEKTFANMPGGPGIKAERVLELNPEHPIFATLTNLVETDKEKLKTYASILYDQSLLLEGMSIEDPVAFTDAVSSLLA